MRKNKSCNPSAFHASRMKISKRFTLKGGNKIIVCINIFITLAKNKIMKELINDLITRSGLNNITFAEAVGTSASYLSQQKKQKNINHQLLIEWAKAFDFDNIEGRSKEYTVKITLNSK